MIDAVPDVMLGAMSVIVAYAAAARSMRPKGTKNLARDASSLCCEFVNIAELGANLIDISMSPIDMHIVKTDEIDSSLASGSNTRSRSSITLQSNARDHAYPPRS